MNKKIYCLGYGPTRNIGDEIQTIAAKEVLTKLGFSFSGLINRDIPASNEKINLLINGYISHNSLDKLLTTRNINPIFTNLHLAKVEYAKLQPTMELLKKFMPIGCRDRWTTELLQSYSVDAFFNHCLTLALDRRVQEPTEDKVILVDLDLVKAFKLPNEIGSHNPMEVTHKVDPDTNSEIKFAKAQELLDLYRDQAKLIITSRLHCALPCIAMGIPVIMVSNWLDPRLRLAEEFIPLYLFYDRYLPKHDLYNKAVYPLRYIKLKVLVPMSNYMTMKRIDWKPQPLDIEPIKQQIINKLEEQINRQYF